MRRKATDIIMKIDNFVLYRAAPGTCGEHFYIQLTEEDWEAYSKKLKELSRYKPEVFHSMIGPIEVRHSKEIKESDQIEETAKLKIEEYRKKYEHPYQAAERGYVDDVIMPRETRKKICQALEILESKNVSQPWRKYSNICL